MRASIRWIPPADAQADAADAWWRQNRTAARDLFLAELGSAIAQLEHAPESGRPCAHRLVRDLRRLLLPKTGYHIFYVHRPQNAEVLILSVWSAVRGRGPRLSPP